MPATAAQASARRRGGEGPSEGSNAALDAEAKDVKDPDLKWASKALGRSMWIFGLVALICLVGAAGILSHSGPGWPPPGSEQNTFRLMEHSAPLGTAPAASRALGAPPRTEHLEAPPGSPPRAEQLVAPPGSLDALPQHEHAAAGGLDAPSQHEHAAVGGLDAPSQHEHAAGGGLDAPSQHEHAAAAAPAALPSTTSHMAATGALSQSKTPAGAVVAPPRDDSSQSQPAFLPPASSSGATPSGVRSGTAAPTGAGGNLSGAPSSDAGGGADSALSALRSRSKQLVTKYTGKKVKPALAGEVGPLTEPSSNTSVHLIVSAFQDGERCARTMGWALLKAIAPHRVHFHVLQAASEKDHLCADVFVEKQLNTFCDREVDRDACTDDVLSRTHFWTIPLEHGMGPAHQRGVLNELLEIDTADAFCLTTDSHMDFVHGWDVKTIADWRSTDNEFAVLTVYPKGFVQSEREVENVYVDLCGYQMEDGVPRGRGGGDMYKQPGGLPYLTMNWAAGLSFHRCHMDRNVPVDKHLHWIFTGEEIDRAVRLWTHGYDLYLPSDTTILHDYTHAKQSFWRHSDTPSMDEQKHASHERLEALLQLPEQVPDVDLGIYGLGTQRSLEQFVQWSQHSFESKRWKGFLEARGISTRRNNGHDFCSKLERVPVSDKEALAAAATDGFHALTPIGDSLDNGYDVDDPTNPQVVVPYVM